jgi:hypothetical protein
LSPEQIDEGVARLARLVREHYELGQVQRTG